MPGRHRGAGGVGQIFLLFTVTMPETLQHNPRHISGEWTEPVGLLRSVVLGALVGVVASFVVTTVGMLLADVEMASAVGLGLFIAFWGGLGFGTMVGGVVWVSNNDKEH